MKQPPGVSRFGSVADDLTKILLQKNGLEGAVNIREFDGTAEVGVAFRQRQIAGAVLANLRVDAPTRIVSPRRVHRPALQETVNNLSRQLIRLMFGPSRAFSVTQHGVGKSR